MQFKMLGSLACLSKNDHDVRGGGEGAVTIPHVEVLLKYTLGNSIVPTNRIYWSIPQISG